jgi:hypothetical protein
MPMIGGTVRFCTAAIVGKRHIISASHCAVWHNLQDDSAPDPMIFEPGYNLGSWYPSAQVIHSYWITKVGGETWQQGDVGGDWLVGVLDRDIENTNGIFGQQLYDSRWNGQYLWESIGYPDDFDEEQVLQSPMAVVQIANVQHGEIYVVGGTSVEGDSGSPLYGTFQNSPRLIGVVVGEASNPFIMAAHGGLLMFDLIATAKAEYP